MGLGWGAYSDHGFRNPLIDLDESVCITEMYQKI